MTPKSHDFGDKSLTDDTWRIFCRQSLDSVTRLGIISMSRRVRLSEY